MVHRSRFDNQEFKYGGLVTEHKKTLQLDRDILKPVTTDPDVKSPFCHIACALRDEKNQKVNELDENNYNETRITLDDEKKNMVFSYLAQVCKINWSMQMECAKNLKMAFDGMVHPTWWHL